MFYSEIMFPKTKKPAPIKESLQKGTKAKHFFVDRFGKAGTTTYQFKTYAEAYAKAEECSKRPDVVLVYLWN